MIHKVLEVILISLTNLLEGHRIDCELGQELKGERGHYCSGTIGAETRQPSL